MRQLGAADRPVVRHFVALVVCAIVGLWLGGWWMQGVRRDALGESRLGAFVYRLGRKIRARR